MRVALLEDDPDQAALTQHWLEHAEHSVACHDTAAGFLRAARRESFDLYILDWVLPDMSGIDVLEKVRGEMDDTTPVIIATVKNEEESIVRGLESGADDYLVKPIRQRELVARVSALLRRSAGRGFGDADVDAAPYRIDTAAGKVSLDGMPIKLTNREFELVVFFFRNAGKMLSRSHILEAIWGIDNKAVSTRTVDTHVSRLRKKLELTAEHGWKLSAIYQHGYRLERIDA